MKKYISSLLLFSFSLLSGMEDAKKDSQYKSAKYAAAHCLAEYLFDLIKEHNLDVNQPIGYMKSTLVHHAARCTDMKEAERIMSRLVHEHQANVQAKNGRGQTPLKVAVQSKSLGAMKALLKMYMYGGEEWALHRALRLEEWALHTALYLDEDDYAKGKKTFRAMTLKKYGDKYGYEYFYNDQLAWKEHASQEYTNKENYLEWLKEEKKCYNDCKKVVEQELKSENIDNIGVIVAKNSRLASVFIPFKNTAKVIFVDKIKFSRLPETAQKAIIRHEIEHIKKEHHKQRGAFYLHDKAALREQECEADRAAFKKYPQGFLELCQLHAKKDELYSNGSFTHPTWKEREKKARNYMKKKEMQKYMEKYLTYMRENFL